MSPANEGNQPGSDLAAWASRIAERLPTTDVRQLADAAAAGPGAVRGLRGRAGAAVLRSACNELLGKLPHADLAYVAGLLTGAGEAVARARRHQHIDVVWTGPQTASGTERLTAATVIDLIDEARREILIVSYATQNEKAIASALEAAVVRGVEVTVLAELHDDNPGYNATGTPFPGLLAIRLRWPASRRPAGGSALHAKIIVIDDRVALVGSANLTGRAMEANLECGILIRGGNEPGAIRSHIVELQSRGILQRSLP